MISPSKQWHRSCRWNAKARKYPEPAPSLQAEAGPGGAAWPWPSRHARPWWRHGLFVCNLAILHTSSPLPPRTRTLGHLASPARLQSTTYTSYVLPIAIALSHENEYIIFFFGFCWKYYNMSSPGTRQSAPILFIQTILSLCRFLWVLTAQAVIV